MTRKLSEWLYARAKGRTILLILVSGIILLGGSFAILATRYPDLTELKSLDAPRLDSPAEIESILESWGEEGRKIEFWFHLTWDTVLPVLSFLILGLSLSWLLDRNVSPNSALRRLNLLALVSIFDLLENTAIEILAFTYPAHPGFLVKLKPVLSLTKYGSGALILILMTVLFVIAASRGFKR